MKKIMIMGAVAIMLASFSRLPLTTNSPDNEKIRLQINYGNNLSALMDGAQEPAGGDPDGSGFIELDINQGQGTISYFMTVENIEPATAAHIHIGQPGVAGPVVVPLNAPTTGSASGVATVDKALAKDIRKNPGKYYVNVHNAPYPAGAVRGQLSR